MGSAEERKPGPISIVICLAAAAATLGCAALFMPAAELLPAQVNPEARVSGESCVRIPELMKQYGSIGVSMLDMLPKQPQSEEQAGADALKNWEAELLKKNGEVYGKELRASIESSLGGEENLKKVVGLMNVDKNYVYNAYALFLGLALLAGALGIQAMGRWGAEEKTILPAKK
ncbi:MAG: hypothetical protein K2X27_04870 [Candidatus Obscuribacterales bacterium]|nr:hypothetical protein [Candidatus Obscuribacterales bacterium]